MLYKRGTGKHAVELAQEILGVARGSPGVTPDQITAMTARLREAEERQAQREPREPFVLQPIYHVIVAPLAECLISALLTTFHTRFTPPLCCCSLCSSGSANARCCFRHQTHRADGLLFGVRVVVCSGQNAPLRSRHVSLMWLAQCCGLQTAQMTCHSCQLRSCKCLQLRQLQ